MNGGLAAERFDLGRDSLQLGLAAPGQDDVAAGARQFQRNAAPDALARPGHQRDLAAKLFFHPTLRSIWVSLT